MRSSHTGLGQYQVQQQGQQDMPSPAYQWLPVETFTAGRWAFHRYPVPRLPTGPNQSWTINLFLKADAAPTETTIIGGFGDAVDTTGTQRYVILYQSALGFWGSNADCLTNGTVEVGKWQMVTVTYDGNTVSVYVNAKQIKSSPVALKEAEPVVNLATQGPWAPVGVYHGQIAKFSIWASFLQSQDIDTLFRSGPPSEEKTK